MTLKRRWTFYLTRSSPQTNISFYRWCSNFNCDSSFCFLQSRNKDSNRYKYQKIGNEKHISVDLITYVIYRLYLYKLRCLNRSWRNSKWYIRIIFLSHISFTISTPQSAIHEELLRWTWIGTASSVSSSKGQFSFQQMLDNHEEHCRPLKGCVVHQSITR